MPKIERKGNHFAVKPTYEEKRKQYLEKIQEAQLLGDTDEVNRFQQEWQQKKKELVQQQPKRQQGRNFYAMAEDALTKLVGKKRE